MLNQAREFNDSVAVTGLILTKLDGSARGGAVVGPTARLMPNKSAELILPKFQHSLACAEGLKKF